MLYCMCDTDVCAIFVLYSRPRQPSNIKVTVTPMTHTWLFCSAKIFQLGGWGMGTKYRMYLHGGKMIENR